MTRWLGFLRAWGSRSLGPAGGGRLSAAPDTPGEAVPACSFCRHFCNDPAGIEAAMPGLASLSSGYASVRGEDGLCLKHDRFVAATSNCRSFQGRAARLAGGAAPTSAQGR